MSHAAGWLQTEFSLLYRSDTFLCTSEIFTEAGSVAANPFLCGVKENKPTDIRSLVKWNGGVNGSCDVPKGSKTVFGVSVVFICVVNR